MLFYVELEQKLANRRKVEASFMGTQMGVRLTTRIAQTIRVAPSTQKVKGIVQPSEWTKILADLEDTFNNQDWLLEMACNVQERATRG